MKMQPVVSVVIPAYNVENTIIETLESILNQTYENVEIVVVNDGSTDRTLEVLTCFAVDQPNIKIYSQENKGLPATRNAGFLSSTGEFLVFLDADDKLDPVYIESCYIKFDQNPRLDLVYTGTKFFEAKTGVFDLPIYSYRQLLAGNCIPATAMIRAESFRDIGMYDESLRFTEDWELWIRYLYKYPNVCKIQQLLFFYRQRFSKDSMTDWNKKCNVSEEAMFYIYNKHYAIFKEYGFGIDKLLDYSRYKNKYHSVWYRKLFYKLFKRKKQKRN